MKLLDLNSNGRKKDLVSSFWVRLILGIGIGIFVSSSSDLLPHVRAQIEPALFPGNLVVEGDWPAIGAGHTLIYLGRNRLLDWEPASGRYRIWQYDPSSGGRANPLSAQPIVEGTWPDIGAGHELVYLGKNRLLDWVPASGRYRIWHYDPSLTGRANPLSAQPIVEGTWPDIGAGHELISLSSEKILDWEPTSGRYRIWQYDPSIRGNANPLLEKPAAEGTWPDIHASQALVYLGVHRMLDWEPPTGRYRIRRYDPPIREQSDPFPGNPVVDGTWSTIGSGHELVYLGENRVLDWEPASGHYRIWQYELIAVAAFTLEDIAMRLSNQTVTGGTIITHGFQFEIPFANDEGDALEQLAKAIHEKAGGWLLDYDVPGDGEDGFFDTCTNDCGPPEAGEKGAGEVVLLFDWSPESNESSDGWGEAAGDALFSMLVGLGLIAPVASDNIPLHFIGHSFGTAVTSEAIERLARFGVRVDHVTYLDPHDFDQGILPIDGAQKLFELGQPQGYGASVWKNIAFADVYYQTLIAPDGRPIPGAYNKVTNDLIPISEFPHTYVWKCLYRGTVIGVNPNECNASTQPFDYSQNGYAFSRIAASPSQRPNPTFYGADQNHEHSNPQLVDTASGQPNPNGLADLGLTAEQITQGGWKPAWNPLTVINGDFENYNDGGLCGISNTCIQPGWSHHGGGGEAHFDEGNNDVYLVLDWGNVIHAHNWLYVPPGAVQLQFDLRRVDGPSGEEDTLDVQLGSQTLISYLLKEGVDFEDDNFVTQQVEIPENLEDQMITLTFRILNIELLDGSEVWLDDVRFLRAVYLPLILK